MDILAKTCAICKVEESNKVRLVNRYEEEILFERWCFSCVIYHMNTGLLDEPPSWLIYLFRKHTRLEYRAMGWRRMLQCWVSVQKIKDRRLRAVGKESDKMNLATWHVYRYKLMYESDNAIWRDNVYGNSEISLHVLDGIQCIKYKGKMISNSF